MSLQKYAHTAREAQQVREREYAAAEKARTERSLDAQIEDLMYQRNLSYRAAYCKIVGRELAAAEEAAEQQEQRNAAQRDDDAITALAARERISYGAAYRRYMAGRG